MFSLLESGVCSQRIYPVGCLSMNNKYEYIACNAHGRVSITVGGISTDLFFAIDAIVIIFLLCLSPHNQAWNQLRGQYNIIILNIISVFTNMSNIGRYMPIRVLLPHVIIYPVALTSKNCKKNKEKTRTWITILR